MAHARREEEAGGTRGSCGPPICCVDALVVVDVPSTVDQRIGHAVPQEQPAAAIAERRQIRIVGADDRVELLDRLIEELLV